jgi:hypothetical protein
MQPQYFITTPDPDYLPKGAVDPLGFQVIWQHQGKKLIPYLSTVSILARDFQVLCIARYLYGQDKEAGWPKYFLRFEQLMAYARCIKFPRVGFNGVDRVRNRVNELNRFPISNNPNDEILSNQRSYGVWGKYIRPFLDIGFDKDEMFYKIYGDKLNQLSQLPEFKNIIQKLKSGERFTIDRDLIQILFPLFDFDKNEKEFLVKKIMRFETTGAYQNRLFDYVHSTKSEGEFKLYEFLQDFSNYLNKDEVALKEILVLHEQTEKVLSPISTIFRYLQTKPLWTKDEIQKDEYITNCKLDTGFRFPSGEKNYDLLNHFRDLMNENNWNIIEALHERNCEVTAWRGGASWITINKDILEVRHSDGAKIKKEFNPQLNQENEYFFPTFISIYQQLMQA